MGKKKKAERKIVKAINSAIDSINCSVEYLYTAHANNKLTDLQKEAIDKLTHRLISLHLKFILEKNRLVFVTPMVAPLAAPPDDGKWIPNELPVDAPKPPPEPPAPPASD